MLYQALLGAWEEGLRSAEFVDRIKAYAIKAAREGKQETSWTNPSEVYEQGMVAFIDRLLNPNESAQFLESFRSFADRVARLGVCNSLSQLVLKCLLPGLPDFYQGTEFLDLSLVDPDNRRPVDFVARHNELQSFPKAQYYPDSPITSKLDLIRRLLHVRHTNSDLFESGTYQSMEVTGRDRDHVIAFARVRDGRAIVVATIRHFAALTGNGRHWPRLDNFDAHIVARGLRPARDLLRNEAIAQSPLTLRVPMLVAQCDVDRVFLQ